MHGRADDVVIDQPQRRFNEAWGQWKPRYNASIQLKAFIWNIFLHKEENINDRKPDERKQSCKGEYALIRKKNSAMIMTVILMCVFIFSLSDILLHSGGVYAAGSGISDVQLLARAINGEARGEPYEGQVAVGAVIINRTKDSNFPNTIAGVIYQPGAFTAVDDGQINVPIDPKSTVVKAAQDALNGWDPSNGALYYWNPATATSSWIWSRKIVLKIGKHNFGI